MLGLLGLGVRPGQGRLGGGQMATLEKTLALTKLNDRVCPQPHKWKQLYEMLPNRKSTDRGWKPSLPLILAAWWEASDIDKATRLQEHLEWASQQGVLDLVHEFLESLTERDWHHAGK